MRSLETVLVEAGLQAELAGWELTSVTGISADGRTVVGAGINPNGQQEGWIAVIPEPSTLNFLGFAAALVARRRRA